MAARHFQLLLISLRSGLIAEKIFEEESAKNHGLHLSCVRDLFAMRKQFNWAARLILVALIVSLASCQSGGGGTSKADVTDPNVSFSNPSTREH
jgi:hypothetical protein